MTLTIRSKLADLHLATGPWWQPETDTFHGRAFRVRLGGLVWDWAKGLRRLETA